MKTKYFFMIKKEKVIIQKWLLKLDFIKNLQKKLLKSSNL